MVRVTLSPPSMTPESITTMPGKEADERKIVGVFGHKDGSENGEKSKLSRGIRKWMMTQRQDEQHQA